MSSTEGYVDMWHIMEALQSRYLLTQQMLKAILKLDSSANGGSALTDEIKDFLDKGADADGMPGASMLRPLHAAAKIGRADIIEVLVEAGADINTVDAHNSRAPLHYAAEVNADAVGTLLKYGALADVSDADGNTPLHWASYKNNYACVRCLLRHKATVNALNITNNTPLSFATMKGNCECVRLLLDYGADPQLSNDTGVTPLIRAATMQYSQLNSYEDDVCFDLLLCASGRLSLRDATEYEEGNVSPSAKDMHQFLVSLASQVPHLSSLCRASIRQQLLNRYVPDAVDSLRLPDKMKKFILLRDKR